jgi:hypothetical protein
MGNNLANVWVKLFGSWKDFASLEDLVMRSISDDEFEEQPEDSPRRLRLVQVGTRRAGLGNGAGGSVASRLRRRAGADVVLARAHLLEAADRGVIEAIYGSGQSATQVARVLGVPARKMCDRVRAVVKRLRSRECTLVDTMGPKWGTTRRGVAVACFVHGLSIRRASERLGITFYAARQHYAAVRAILDAAA